MNNTLYIGLMSGTSMDAIDAALVLLDQEKCTLIGTATTPLPFDIKKTLHALCTESTISIKALGETDTQLGHLFADTCLTLLKTTGKKASEITAIGSHGQTIYHHPTSAHPFTLQIADPNIIASRTNITTVADFRRRDMALGGQGAPLVPAFHRYLFKKNHADQYVVNIGGIANITYLPHDSAKPMIGFDTGPGNTLLDLWHQKYREKPMDLNGEWGRSGKLNQALLQTLLDDPYFKKPFPKSTGREYFNINWLQQKLIAGNVHDNTSDNAHDIQNTLTELTAITIAHAISHTGTLWLCGGGAKNIFLVERLRHHCPHVGIQTTEKIGIDPQWIEAAAFAWLAKQTIEKNNGNCMSVTGASKETILGAIYW